MGYGLFGFITALLAGILISFYYTNTTPKQVFQELEVVDVSKLPQTEQEDFLAALPSRPQPVVIKGLQQISKWNALTKWDPTYLQTILGEDFQMQNVLINSVPKYLFFQKRAPMVTGFKKYTRFQQPCNISSLAAKEFFAEATKDPADKYLYFSSSLSQLPSQLSDDLTPHNGLLQENSTFNIWLTSPHVTSQLHCDTSPNFFVQIKGRKRMTLFPPDDWPNLYLFPRIHPGTRQSQVDLASPSAYPNFANARPATALLQPGDMLWIPSMWFHHVETLDFSVSASVYKTNPLLSSVLSTIYSEELKLKPINPDIVRGAAMTSFLRKLIIKVLNVKPSPFLVELFSSRYGPLKDKDPLLQYKHKQPFKPYPSDTNLFCDPSTAGEVERAMEEVGEIIAPLITAIGDQMLTLPKELRSLILADFIEELLHYLIGFPNFEKFMNDCFNLKL